MMIAIIASTTRTGQTFPVHLNPCGFIGVCGSHFYQLRNKTTVMNLLLRTSTKFTKQGYWKNFSKQGARNRLNGSVQLLTAALWCAPKYISP
ncbi:hypothetical protein OUZ56_005905 [Daphnia magna]|uniref:Uncharacterized protein n=1 Tax=Daphnia magna TaxID=35525 RepID=A0ABQ9YU31_9CRUS|nr:hypothetical protein OUZ56_005905 [Daphnia magna]